eukprot:TRINITY_DN30714_c1_g1_i1.p1 TRINITY_DN30714_c1_g1~~TRINITY_DN30714_c1_g1_i1.p1  ORF type:complete len:118 (+),score=14.92 TRINITY_DN30714_c1_g1_i1:227-580(+)
MRRLGKKRVTFGGSWRSCTDLGMDHVQIDREVEVQTKSCTWGERVEMWAIRIVVWVRLAPWLGFAEESSASICKAGEEKNPGSSRLCIIADYGDQWWATASVRPHPFVSPQFDLINY